MTDSSKAVQLHHRWALGELLTIDEQKILDAWYAEKDAEEAATLGMGPSSDELTNALKKQINEMLHQISVAVKRIQQLTTENEHLKQENDKLKRLITQRLKQPQI